MNFQIQPDNTWALWAVIIIGTCVAIWLEQTFRWAAKISGPVLALVMAMLLSNIGIMPSDAPSYSFVGDYLVPLAIPLLLMRANFLRIARETGGMFAAFHLSVVGTIVGAAIATLCLHGHVERIAGVAGIMTASYSGGGVNFFAVRESFDVPEHLTGPLLVADNFIMAGMFIVLLGIVGNQWFRKRFPTSQGTEDGKGGDETAAADHWRPRQISLLDLAKSLAIAFGVVAAAHQIRGFIVSSFEPSFVTAVAGNLFVLITFLAMCVATAFHRQVSKINGAEEMGSFMLFVFLFTIGLPADLVAVVRNTPLLFVFCLIMAISNLVVTLTLGKLLKIDLEELVLCVNASLGGPPSAIAMAIAKGWKPLIVPSLLVGIWGYVIGTFLGVLVGELLLRVFGGS